MLTEEGNLFGFGNQGKKVDLHDSIHSLTCVNSIHKFLLKKLAPKIKPKQYYSRKCSPDKSEITDSPSGSSVKANKVFHNKSKPSSKTSLILDREWKQIGYKFHKPICLEEKKRPETTRSK